jgi:hypothetical protein
VPAAEHDDKGAPLQVGRQGFSQVALIRFYFAGDVQVTQVMSVSQQLFEMV